MFRYSKNPTFKKIWDTKMASDEKSLFKKGDDGVRLILEDPRYAMFTGVFLKHSDEYRQCYITDIKRSITKDR